MKSIIKNLEALTNTEQDGLTLKESQIIVNLATALEMLARADWTIEETNREHKNG